MILLGEAHHVCRHLFRIVLNHVLLIEQRGRAVSDRVEQVAARPVKDRHEVVADDLYAERCEITDRLNIVFDILLAGGKSDLDIIMHVYGFHDVRVEARRLDPVDNLRNLLRLPYLARHLIVQRPDDCADPRNLPDVLQGDPVIPFAVPAKSHLHRHRKYLLFVFCFYCSKTVASFRWIWLLHILQILL